MLAIATIKLYKQPRVIDEIDEKKFTPHENYMICW